MNNKYICLHKAINNYQIYKVLIRVNNIAYAEEYSGDIRCVKTVIQIDGMIPLLVTEDIEVIRKMIERGAE